MVLTNNLCDGDDGNYPYITCRAKIYGLICGVYCIDTKCGYLGKNKNYERLRFLWLKYRVIAEFMRCTGKIRDYYDRYDMIKLLMEF